MTRNRDAMTLLDMARLCLTSGTVIVATMLLLGTMMVYQKPEAGLVLAATPDGVPMTAPASGLAPGEATRVATTGAERPTS